MRDSFARRVWTRTDGLYALMVLVALTPLALARYPLCVDCLNHMVRLHILAAPDDAPISRFYDVQWVLSANLGFEIVALPLSWLFDGATVLAWVWGLTVVGLGAGVWFVHRALYQHSQVPLLLAGLMLFNLPLTSGFLGFSLGLGLALFGIGGWLRWCRRPNPSRLLFFNLWAAATLLFHVAALAALALSVVGAHALRGGRLSLRRLGEAMLGFLLPALLFACIALDHPTVSGAQSDGSLFYSLIGKMELPIAPVFTGHLAADLIGALVLWGGALAAWRFGGARLHPALVPVLIVWPLVLMALPREIGNASAIDVRLAVIPVLLLVAGLRLAPGRWARRIGSAAMAAVLLRLVLILPAWRAHDVAIQSFQTLETRVPWAAKVLTVGAPQRPGCRSLHWPSFDEHIPTLLVRDRGAFVSTLFADPHMQPIRPAAEVQGLAMPNTGILPWTMVVAGERAARDPASWQSLPPAFRRYYPLRWRRHYDVVAMVEGDCADTLPKNSGLAPIGRSQRVTLYRVKR